MRIAVLCGLLALSAILLVFSAFAVVATARDADTPAGHGQATSLNTSEDSAEQHQTSEEPMTATATLRNEHRLISQVVSALRRMAQQGGESGRIDGEAAGQALEFIRGFTDQCHHAKEEQHLFPQLIAAGLPAEEGPVATMIDEHEQGRALVRIMAESAAQAAAGDAQAVARWTTAAAAYADLLDAHIAKENDVLFVMADRMLSEDQQRLLISEFERVEIEEMGEGTHERFHEIGEELVRQFGVAEQPGCGSGCGH